MGVWFAKFFHSKDYDVILADRKKEKLENLKNLMVDLTTDFQEAVQDADQILLCVSINAIEEVVKAISPVPPRRASGYGYLLHQRSPSQNHAPIHQGRHSFGYASCFWTRKQRRQTQSLRLNSDQPQRARSSRKNSSNGSSRKKHMFSS